jgi:hypothetical protein
VLALVRAEDRAGNVITSSFSDHNDDQSPEYPYLVQITSGPEVGDDFVGLYTLDGDQVETGNGWTWEIVDQAPAEVINAIETGWETGTSVVERIGAGALVSRAHPPVLCSACGRELATGPFSGPVLDAADAGRRLLCAGCRHDDQVDHEDALCSRQRREAADDAAGER